MWKYKVEEPIKSHPLDKHHFNDVGHYPKFPFMKNKKRLDPIVRDFLFMSDSEFETGYGLPKPNLQASYKSMAKYAKAQVPYNEEAMAFAFQALCKHFGPYMEDSKISTFEEGWENCDKHTSAGFPWNLEYVDKEDMSEEMFEEFKEYTDKAWDYLLEEDYFFVFVNSLKEEIRLIEKIKKNSIRTFTASPVEAVVNGYRLFGDMNQKFYDSHLKTVSAVGMCPFYGGWDTLYKKLNNVDGEVCAYALDESEFDSSLRQILFDACLRFRWKCLADKYKTPENYKRMCNYYKNLVLSVIITADGHIVQKKTGNPSGGVNTISDNTFILFMLLAYAWYMLAEEDKKTYLDFITEVNMALQGDDNTWTVNQIVNKYFNGKTVSDVFTSLGVTTTSDSYEARKLSEVDFLSSRFDHFIKGKCVYALYPEKLVESLKWTSHPGDIANTLVRVGAMLRVCWPDRQMRKLCREMANYIIREYDMVLQKEKSWLMAKAQILTDEEYMWFYTDSGGLIRSSPIKRDMSDLVSSLELVPVQAKKGKNVRRQRKIEKKVVKKMAQKLGRQNAKPKRKRNKKNKNREMEYTVSAPIATGKIRQMSRPSFGNKSKFVVSQKEFITDLNGSVAFTVNSFSINPGLNNTFPWLQQFGPNFEQYRFKNLEFCFESEQASSSIGSIMMAVDYDAADLAPASKQQLMTYDGATRGQPWTSFTYKTDPVARKAYLKRYIRTGTLSANLDIKTYDVGTLFVATQGQADASVIGELYVKYDVEFFTPAADANTPVSGGRITAGGTITAANVLGTAPVVDGSASGLSVDANSLVTVDRRGTYIFEVVLQVPAAATLTATTGATVVTNTGSAAQFIGTQIIYLNAKGTFQLGTLSQIPTGGFLYISMVPSIQSVTFSEQKEEVNEKLVEMEGKLNRLIEGLRKRENSQIGLVKLPRLSSKKVVDAVSDEE